MPLADLQIAAAQVESAAPLVTPFEPALLQPASYDVRIGNGFRPMRRPQFGGWSYPSVGMTPEYEDEVHVPDSGEDGKPCAYVMEPGDFVLAHTLEEVCLPDDMVATLEGKSTLGRYGLAVHTTAGFIDPGFRGHITLELTVVGTHRIGLQPGMPIAQLVFDRLTMPARRPYGHPDLGSHYQGQTGATAPAGRDRAELTEAPA